jgi:glycosyltransferase involved in cell wall biosynthesis
VITDKGDTKEYFEDYAYYCDPAEPESILNAIKVASSSSVNDALRQKILAKYTWKHSALQTLKAYQLTAI